jgi:hypothetical protein
MQLHVLWPAYEALHTLPPSHLQVFPTVKETLSEVQLIQLQQAVSTATLADEPVVGRVNNRIVQKLNARHVFASR